jgi:hypothetical protein
MMVLGVNDGFCNAVVGFCWVSFLNPTYGKVNMNGLGCHYKSSAVTGMQT